MPSRRSSLARSRYEQGVADFTTLLDDARTVLQAEQQLAQSTTNVSVDLVALYKALGGGWEMTYPDERAVRPPILAAATAQVGSSGGGRLDPEGGGEQGHCV